MKIESWKKKEINKETKNHDWKNLKWVIEQIYSDHQTESKITKIKWLGS